MTPLVIFEQPDATPLYRGAVELDIDPAAERYAVLDRRDMKPLMFGPRPSSGIARFIVPFDYTTNNQLLALILDDTGTPVYNVAGADKIQAAVVDAKSAGSLSN